MQHNKVCLNMHRFCGRCSTNYKLKDVEAVIAQIKNQKELNKVEGHESIVNLNDDNLKHKCIS